MTVGVINKWTGTTTISGDNIATAAISLSSVDKGLLMFNVQGLGQARPDRDTCSGYISSTTEVTFQTDSNVVEPITVEWEVLELSGDVTVQQGLSNITSVSTNISLSALTSVDQSVEFHMGQRRSGTTLNNDDAFRAEITSTTNLLLALSQRNPSHSGAWQVLDFSQASDMSVQRGTTSLSTSDTSINQGIGSVTLGKSLLLLNGSTFSGSNPNPNDWGLTGAFNSATEFNIQRVDSGNNLIVGWSIAECGWLDASIQTGSKVLSSTTLNDTVSISSVNTDASIVYSSTALFGGFSQGRSSVSSGDNALQSSGSWKFNSPTEIRVDRGSSAGDQTWQWYVFELESGAVTPVLTIQDLDHAHDLEAPTISTETQSDLTVQVLDHAHELESPTISTEAGVTLTVQDLDHTHDLESPTISTELSYLLVLQELNHGHDLESPNLSKDKELVIQELLHAHDLESPTIALFDAFGGFARRKLAGTGLNYVQYPNTGNPENFRVDPGVKTLIVEEWHPNVVDGLTKCQVRMFRDSTLIRAVSYDQNVNGGQWNQLFLEEDPAAGDYFLRTMDDQQSGTGGTGTYVYADAFQVTIDAAPQLTPQPMVHLHTMSNIGLLGDYTLQINNLDHSHQLEAPTISDVKVATAQDIDHGHLLDSPTITTDVQDALVVGDLTHSHDLEAPTVSYNFVSTVNDLDHGHDLEQATITGELSLVIQDVDHGHDIESPTIATGDVAAAANLVHSQSIDNVVLESFSILPAVKELLHDGHEIDNVDLTYNQQLTLVIDDMTHNHVLDETTITTDPVLFIDSIDHAHVIDSLELSASSSLQSFDMNHPHTIDTVDAFFEEDLPPLDRTYLVKPENINYIVKPENNTYVVK